MTPGVWIALAIVVGLLSWAVLRSRDTTISMAGAVPAASAAGPAAEVTSLAAPEADRVAERLPHIPLEARETVFFGRWQQGEHDGCRVAFQTAGKGVAIFAGSFDADAEQLTETYLGQVSESQPLPGEGSPQRLAQALGADGAELDGRFFLYATGGPYPQLEIPAVRDALGALSESVEEVMLFQSNGVQIIAGGDATPGSIAADLNAAIALVRALSSQ